MSSESFYELPDDPRQPVSLTTLREMARTGVITGDALVRDTGSDEWIRADQVDGMEWDSSQFVYSAAGDGHAAAEEEKVSPRRAPAFADARRPADTAETDSEPPPEEEFAESANDAAQRPGRRRFRLWFVVSTLGICLATPLLAWYVLAPSPADRFKVFAKNAKNRLAGQIDEKAKGAFLDYFHYEVRKTEATETVLAEYRAKIFFLADKRLVEYNYDYSGGHWVCVGSRMNHGQGKIEIRRGRELAATPDGKILTACEKY